jgi:hypothetical protein
LLIETPDEWYILEAEVTSISLSKASQQWKEAHFDDALETILTIWALLQQAHSMIVDVFRFYVEEVVSNRRFSFEREAH